MVAEGLDPSALGVAEAADGGDKKKPQKRSSISFRQEEEAAPPKVGNKMAAQLKISQRLRSAIEKKAPEDLRVAIKVQRAPARACAWT